MDTDFKNEAIPLVKVYHCNSKEKCNQFLKNNVLLESNHPDDSLWLGRGMYFWDNMGNAKYWKRQKIIKNDRIEYKILSCFVILEKMLDLTDSEEIKILNKIWDELDISPKLNSEKKRKLKIGDKLNFLFDSIPKFSEQYDIIKTIGENYKNSNKFFDNTNSKNIRPGLSSKVIYNVKKIDCVRNGRRVIIDE